jgi:hypothetical protein
VKHRNEQVTDFSALDRFLDSLQERAKEFNCLVKVEDILSHREFGPAEFCPLVLKAIVAACKYPNCCSARIRLGEALYVSDRYVESAQCFTADITAQDMAFGSLTAFYSQEMPPADCGPFYKEEIKLFGAIASRLGQHLLHQQMHRIFQEWESAKHSGTQKKRERWQVVLEFLEHTDPNLFLRISRKMLYHLCWTGVAKAESILRSYCDGQSPPGDPSQSGSARISSRVATDIFRVAGEQFSEDKLLSHIQKWIGEDRMSNLIQVVDRQMALGEVADAIRRYSRLTHDTTTAFSPSKKSVQVSLIRRILSEQKRFINVAKNFVDLPDFHRLLDRIIFTSESHGRLGGKSAGLYLAQRIIERKAQSEPLLADIVVPKTWYISSDVILHFMHFNNLDDVMEQKYKNLEQVRMEYPHIVQTFRSAQFPDEIIKGLSMALDDLEGRPLIVRSSNILEDCFTVAFPRKYKSVFLANQGTKQERLAALITAIADVYSSTFSPDPIAYRAEKELIDFGEEMGIMIQEVAGTAIGKYYFPALSGIGYSCREYYCSPTSKKTDAVLYMAPGLGTRTWLSDADRLAVVLGTQPDQRFKISSSERVKQAPKYIDLINLETRETQTHELREFLRSVRADYPGFDLVFSQFKDGELRRPSGPHLDWGSVELAATCGTLLERTPFVKKMQMLLQTLEVTLVHPVTIEFAFDGSLYYLLQCRAQALAD